LTEPRRLERPSAIAPPPGQTLVSRAPAPRRIVVSPDQIFPQEASRRLGLSLEGVVIRYMLISAAIVATVSVLAVLGLALLGA
jgi:hypothetical protein